MGTWTTKSALGAYLLLALAPLGFAQEDESIEPAEEAVPRYQVEVILFAHRDADPNEELFSLEQAAVAPAASAPAPIEQEVYGLDRLRLQDLPSGEAAPPINGLGSASTPAPIEQTPQTDELQPIEILPPRRDVEQPFRFRLLTHDEMQLNDEYAKIARLDAYQPLAHAGWIQDGLPENEARPIDMAYLGVVNPSGTIELYVSRFLHLTVDLSYRAPQSPAVTPDATSFDPPGLRELDLAPRYVMQQQRRARSGELHYIDHPMFGLLFLITPVPEEPEQPGEAADKLTPAA